MTNRNYANQNLENSSFKGQDLAGADFSGSDLRGCDFSKASLIGATFEDCQMGQSLRQHNSLIITAIVGPIALVGFSAIAVQVSDILFRNLPTQVTNFFWRMLPFLALIANLFLRDSITVLFPAVATFFSIGAIATFFAVMVALTVGLMGVSLSSFGGGGATQGFFLLLLMVIFALLTFRIFNWVVQAIQSHPGTSFRKADLTNADFSRARVQNTDFSLALLTGACIFNWSMNGHTQLTTAQCDYLYLEPEQQNRRPSDRTFQSGELNRLLTQFIQ